MLIDWYVIESGAVVRRPAPAAWPSAGEVRPGESWLDIRDGDPDQVAAFLGPLGLHPLALRRCIAPAGVPGAISYGPAIVLEYPTGLDAPTAASAYVTLVLQGPVLLTIRRGALPEFDAFAQALTADGAPPVLHLAQVVYEMIDALTDPGVKAEIDLRERLQRASRALDERPDSVAAADLTRLHWEVGALVSLIENQLYAVAALNASDNEALREPHRKAYIGDLVSELELAQRGAYRLEARVNDLDSAYQLASSSRVERRLRILTVVSAVTLPLGLIAGLLGMNVGGVPLLDNPNGFAIVSLVMAAIVVIELWYFRRNGWFD